MNASKTHSETLTMPKKPFRKQKPSSHPTSIPSEDTRLLALAEEVANFGSWEWDITKPRAVWSREMFRIFGLEPQSEGLTLEEFRSFIHPDDLDEVTEKMQNAFSVAKVGQKGNLDYRIIRHDGSVRIIHSQRQVKAVTDTGQLKVVVGVDQDVTDQRTAAQVSAENAKLLALAEELAHFGSWQLDVSQPRATWSPGMFRVFGVEPPTKGFTWEEYVGFIHPDDRDAAMKNAQTMFNSPLNHRESFDYRITRCDGAVRILHAQRQVREVDATGKTKVVVGVDQDVTEQRKAEQALKLSEERFRIVAEAANVMVYETDVQTRKIRYLHGMEQLGGYKTSEIDLTLDWVISQIQPDDIPRVTKKWREVTNNPNLDHYVVEYRFLHKNGHYITVKDTARAIKDSSGKTIRFIGGIRDITQRRRDQEKIRQYSRHLEELVEERTKKLVDYERLATVGQIAGMVGHDIRNPLQALTGEVYLIRAELDSISEENPKQNIIDCLDSVDESIGYINKIVADLQDYSRQLNPECTEVNIADLIGEVFKAISVPNKIQLSFNLKNVPKVAVDPTFLRRALTNLINNAIQAMPEGGNLTISGRQQDNKIHISVADTGLGIPEDVKAKLFTPMFTTKAKGQGLGLAVVKRLVEAQGGSISFESAVGKGTKFLIKLPVETKP